MMVRVGLAVQAVSRLLRLMLASFRAMARNFVVERVPTLQDNSVGRRTIQRHVPTLADYHDTPPPRIPLRTWELTCSECQHEGQEGSADQSANRRDFGLQLRRRQLILTIRTDFEMRHGRSLSRLSDHSADDHEKKAKGLVDDLHRVSGLDEDAGCLFQRCGLFVSTLRCVLNS